MRRIIIISVCIFVLLFAGSLVLLAKNADKFVEKYRHDIAGLAISLDSVDVNWFGYGVTLNGVKVYPKGMENDANILASAGRIKVNLAPLDLLWKTVHIRSLKLIEPKLNYIRTSMKHTNWEALNMSWLKDEEKNKGSLGSWRLRVDKVSIDDGFFNFRDKVTGGKFELREMDALVSNIVDEPDPKKMPSKVSVDGKLADYDAAVKLRGEMNILAEGLNFNFKSQIKNAPITYFAPFYAGSVPFPIESGIISVNSDMKVSKSYLNSVHNASVSSLRVGGINGRIINPLFLRRKTINVTAVVNGDLEKGNLRISSQIGNIVGNSILADAKGTVPVKEVGRNVKEAGEKAGGAFDKLFRRRK